MARRSTDILLVRKDAPVKRMRLGPWLFYFVLLLICLTVAGLAGGGYLLYQQNQALQELVKDNKRMRLVAQNLESMLRDLQDRLDLAASPQAKPEPSTGVKPPPPPPPRDPAPAAAPPPPAPAEDSKPVPASNNGEKPWVSSSAQAQALEPWPTSSDWVDIQKVSTKRSGRELLVYFNVVSKKDNSRKPVEGYVAVILRGERKGAPWLEAWPPIHLTPLGRPEDYKRTANFEVKRYRRLRARFALVDKKVETLEFLVYDKEGELVLLKRHPMDQKAR
ncbi:MAG: hypothetical protein KQH53_07495 [Desulfarculaceae bacterium]|nr:hypothetical protein [Desulfarculaceae bacterium]